jgi:predicted neutral ceramidase superfamily lipid hydrolase
MLQKSCLAVSSLFVRLSQAAQQASEGSLLWVIVIALQLVLLLITYLCSNSLNNVTITSSLLKTIQKNSMRYKLFSLAKYYIHFYNLTHHNENKYIMSIYPYTV